MRHSRDTKRLLRRRAAPLWAAFLLLAVLVAVVACGSEDSGQGGPEAGCSASPLDLQLSDQPDLPAAVAALREDIFMAAMACDFDRLEELSNGGTRDFNFTFGGSEGGPAAYWRAAEERGEPVLAWMVTVLDMPYGRVDGQYVWPFAHALDFAALTAADEELLSEHFSTKEVEGWKAAGGYLGYRVGVDEDGEWLYFVAGD